VDDEALIRDLLDRVLGELGYKVLVAHDGEQGLEIFRHQHQAIHCVLLDMVLPDMDGAEVYAAMRQLNPAVRVILCTGYSLEGPAEEMLEQGVAALLRKPFQVEQLSTILRSVLDNPLPAKPS
jgi:CheY-like chemotaxis protein